MASTFRIRSVRAAGKKRQLNPVIAVSNIRDRWYEPARIQLKYEIDKRKLAVIQPDNKPTGGHARGILGVKQ